MFRTGCWYQTGGNIPIIGSICISNYNVFICVDSCKFMNIRAYSWILMLNQTFCISGFAQCRLNSGFLCNPRGNITPVLVTVLKLDMPQPIVGKRGVDHIKIVVRLALFNLISFGPGVATSCALLRLLHYNIAMWWVITYDGLNVTRWSPYHCRTGVLENYFAFNNHNALLKITRGDARNYMFISPGKDCLFELYCENNTIIL